MIFLTLHVNLMIDMFFVYVLRMSDSRYYTGLTGNIFQRFLQHSKGQSKSTRYFRPVYLFALYTVDTRLKARDLEKKIKSRGAYRFVNSYGRIGKG